MWIDRLSNLGPMRKLEESWVWHVAAMTISLRSSPLLRVNLRCWAFGRLVSDSDTTIGNDGASIIISNMWIGGLPSLGPMRKL
jgi:hypothetical protein